MNFKLAPYQPQSPNLICKFWEQANEHIISPVEKIGYLLTLIHPFVKQLNSGLNYFGYELENKRIFKNYIFQVMSNQAITLFSGVGATLFKRSYAGYCYDQEPLFQNRKVVLSEKLIKLIKYMKKDEDKDVKAHLAQGHEVIYQNLAYRNKSDIFSYSASKYLQKYFPKEELLKSPKNLSFKNLIDYFEELKKLNLDHLEKLLANYWLGILKVVET